MANTITINVLGDVRDLQKKLGTATSDLGRLGKASSKAGSILKGSLKAAAGGALLAGVAIAKFGGDSIAAASDLNETISKTKAIFGQATPEVMKFGRTAATSLGLSNNEALTGLSTFGNFFNQIGIGTQKSAELSKGFVRMSADLASFNNAAPVEVMEALAAATRGEYDSLQKYIPTINAAAVEQKALAMTGKDNAKALSAQDKALALNALALKGQGKAAGDFKRTSGGLANQQKILAAQFENVKAKIGTALLPVMLKLMGVVRSTLLPALNKFAAWFKKEGPAAIDKAIAKFNEFLPTIKKIASFVGQNAATLAKLTAAFYAINAVVAIAGPLMKAYSLATGLFAIATKVATAASLGTRVGLAALAIQTAVTSAVTKAAAAAQWLLNAAMLANPIGLVVLAIVALVAAFVIAYKKSETFRNIIDKSWAAIKKATVTVFDFIKKHIKTIMIGILVALTGPLGLAVLLVVKNWNRIKAATSAVWNGIKAVVSGVAKAISSVVKSVFNAIKSVVTSVWNAIKTGTTTTWNAIKNIVSTTINGVMTLVSGIRSRVTGVFSSAGSWLLDAGRRIIQGLLDGINGMIDSVKGKLNELTNAIPDWKGPREKDAKLLRGAGRLIMKGLIKGFDDGRAGVKASLGDITKLIEKTMDKRFKNDKKAKSMTKKALASLENETKALMKNAKRREQVYKKLEKAQDKLKDLRKASADYAKSVKDGVLSYTNVTNLDTAFNADAMIAGLKARLEKVRQFAKLIKTLIAKGLNQTMIDQIVASGVEGGLATASAIAAGGPEAIAEFNTLQTEINSAATSLGNTAANNMYQAGIQAAQGLVKGLQSQKKKLEKWAIDLARTLVNAIKKALGIKSPSRVFAELGRQTVKGMEIGLKDVSGIKTGMTNLANTMTGNFRPELKATALAGASGGNTYQINVTAPATVDKAALGKEIVGAINAYERIGGRKRA